MSHREQKAVLQVVKSLEQQVGIALGEPYSSALKGTKHPLRELRPKRGASPLRRSSTRSIRGGKRCCCSAATKGNDKRFYERTISRAEQLWEAHLAEPEKGSGR